MIAILARAALIGIASTHAEVIFGVDLFARNFTIDPHRGTPDARYDLLLDMAGIWQIEAPNGALVKNSIWQECLEMTITGANAPLHHMIHDGRYITMDKLGPQLGGGDAAWKAIIARPTAMEASYGATSTSVFYVDGGETSPSRSRYDSSARTGSSTSSRMRPILDPGRPGMGNVLVFERNGTLPCDHPYDPRSLYCADKAYDGEDPMAFNARVLRRGLLWRHGGLRRGIAGL